MKIDENVLKIENLALNIHKDEHKKAIEYGKIMNHHPHETCCVKFCENCITCKNAKIKSETMQWKQRYQNLKPNFYKRTQQ